MVGSGRVGDLNAKQENALREFKLALGSSLQPHMDDYYLLRWLRARNFDVRKSTKMLNTSLEWRKTYGTDSILDTWEIPPVLLKYYPGGVHGFDRDGSPIQYDALGYMDIKGISLSAKRSDIVKYRVYFLENLYRILNEQSKKLGRNVEGVNMVFDMEKLGIKFLWKPAIDTFTEILSTVEANYPETLKKCIVINAPRILPVLWNVAKPFLHEETRKKIVICKGDWKERLLSEFDADQIPVRWGGTAVGEDGDPLCGVCMGGAVPDEYRVARLNNVDMADFTSTSVGRGASIQITHEVTIADSVLRWQFQTDGSDIGFGIFKKSQPGAQAVTDMSPVLAVDRVNSHMIPEEGSIKCDTPGTYVILFDNSYSWVNSKKLLYLIEVLEPTPEIEVTAL